MASKWMNHNGIYTLFKEIHKDRPEGHWYEVFGHVALLQTLPCVLWEDSSLGLSVWDLFSMQVLI